MIASDNGSEFTSNATAVDGSGQGGLALHRAGQADPECLHRKLNGRLRDEFLNETLFSSLTHARSALSNWRSD
ncbi:Integrase catalytic region (fragment) [Rhizobium mesoamericanum STM3625]|uniref:Integrase catalytic region n=1 Tax=Rhizobium mesoamericanum STM3625 TaxID=1211777 RepID=K0Q442_9HYPH